jgi:hypothetical protein
MALIPSRGNIGLWGPPILIFKEAIRRLLPSRENCRGVKLTTHLVPRSRRRSYIFTPPYDFMAWCLIKQKASFNFLTVNASNLKKQSNDLHHEEEGNNNEYVNWQ